MDCIKTEVDTFNEFDEVEVKPYQDINFENILIKHEDSEQVDVKNVREEISDPLTIHEEVLNGGCIGNSNKIIGRLTTNVWILYKWVPPVEEKKAHKCEVCNYSTDIQYELRQHRISNHIETNKFKCEECEFSTKYKSCLKDHKLRIHTEASVLNTFKCPQCNFVTKFKPYLNRHISMKHEFQKWVNSTIFKHFKRTN